MPETGIKKERGSGLALAFFCNRREKGKMHWLDWMIVGIPLAVIIGMAFYSQRYARGVVDFLAAGRVAGGVSGAWDGAGACRVQAPSQSSNARAQSSGSDRVLMKDPPFERLRRPARRYGGVPPPERVRLDSITRSRRRG